MTVSEVLATANEHPALAGVVAVVVFVLVARGRVRRARAAAAARRAADRDAATLAALSPRGLEELVGRLLVYDGCTSVEVRGGAGDLGADVVGHMPGVGRVVVQVKHYTRPVGSGALQAFNGTCWSEHGAQRALFVTSAPRFTRAALLFAGRHGIECVDHGGLVAWMATAGQTTEGAA